MKVIQPQLGARSFSCPHCGAIAHQTWYKVFLDQFDAGRSPQTISLEDFKDFEIEKVEDDDIRSNFEKLLKRLEDNPLTYELKKYGENCRIEMLNMWLSSCFSCSGFSIWVFDDVLYPSRSTEIISNDDMPNDIRADFDEAAKIVHESPRGAAALLRLCLQKLMVELGQKGKNINEDIKNLVQKGLDPRVQKALDVVRVIGNNAVHPGQIDLKDDKATAMGLFEVINAIVVATISTSKQIDSLYENLPMAALEAIKKRDEVPE